VKDNNGLLKRIGVGALLVACAAFTTLRFLDDWAPSADMIKTLDAEMDHVQRQMKAWSGSDWSSRQYGDHTVSQTWFVKAPQLNDHELANEVYTLGGYDTLSGRKDGLHMSVMVSSAPSSDWRIVYVEIAMAR